MQRETKYVYFVHRGAEGSSKKAGDPAIVHFLFELLAKQTPAKLSCEIDMRQPRVSKCRMIFNDCESTGRTWEHEQP
jgi:hypothetical protein